MLLEFDRRINFRVSMEMQLYLMEMGDYSQYLRDLIDKDRIARRDPKMVEARIHEAEKLIRDLRQVQTKAKDQATDIDILHKYNKIGKDQGIFEGDVENIHRWIRAHVIPELKKAGYNSYDSHMVINKLITLDKKEEEE